MYRQKHRQTDSLYISWNLATLTNAAVSLTHTVRFVNALLQHKHQPSVLIYTKYVTDLHSGVWIYDPSRHVLSSSLAEEMKCRLYPRLCTCVCIMFSPSACIQPRHCTWVKLFLDDERKIITTALLRDSSRCVRGWTDVYCTLAYFAPVRRGALWRSTEWAVYFQPCNKETPY